MSQIDFTSQCGGDLGVTLNDEVVCMLFIKNDPNTRLITHVEVHDIRKGGYPKILPTLAAGVDHMLVTADLYRTMDIEREIEAQAKKAFGHASYFASNNEEQELVAKFKDAGFDCLLEDKED